MKSNFKYFIVTIVSTVLLVFTGICQDASVGSWVLSSTYTTVGSSSILDEDGLMNYRLDFPSDGDPSFELISSDPTNQTHYDFAFSVGDYSECSGNLNFYLTDNSHYIPITGDLNIYTNRISPVAALLNKNSSFDHQLIYAAELNASNNFMLYYVDITENTNSVSHSLHDFPLNAPNDGISNVAFTVSNVVNGEQFIFTVCGTPGNYYTNDLGLEKYEITQNGFTHESTLVLDSQGSGFDMHDFAGYNLEMQNKNEVDDPIIAWIRTPISSSQINDKIYIYDPIYANDNYILGLGSIGASGTGRIGGIEFSPFQNEEDYMFVSTQNLGLIKINWKTGALIHQFTPTQIDFSHTSVQTAPNGKVYAVSDDGTSLGEIGPNNSFDSDAFTYPTNIVNTVSTHLTYKLLNISGQEIRYFTLPDNNKSFEPSFQNLLVIDANSSQNIPSLSDMTWDANDNFPNNTLLFEHGFILRDNVTLNINDLKLEFNQLNDAKIIIEPGSKLIIDNSELTDHHCYESGKWGGIEVWGDPNESQRSVSGNYKQAYLELKNDAIIRNAQTAVLLGKSGDFNNSGGGIIKAHDAFFINNAKSLYFYPYKNMIVIGNDPAFEGDNEAFSGNCEFEINQDYYDDSEFYKHVDAVEVRGIEFKACDFKRLSNDNTSQYCAGIDAYSAGLKVNSLSAEPCTFYGLYRGINLSENNSSTTYSSFIQNSEFTNNSIGIELNSMNSVVTIKDNTFNVGYNAPGKEICSTSQGYGIFLNNSNTFVIQDNKFYKYTNAPSSGDYIGIEAFNTQTASDEIFRNKFEGLTYANHAENNNYNSLEESEGLTYYCNENNFNVNDFYITYDDDSYLFSGIQSGQGDEDHSTGNTFSENISGKHIFNNAYNHIGYYFNDDINIPETPTEYSSLKVTTHSQSVAADCGSGGISPKELTESEKSNLESEYLTAEADYQSVTSLYESLLDGGSTVELQTEVNTTWPNEMWELRAELLGLSPYLSKEVLITAADKTDVLTESVLFEILSANPEELKKEELITYLENKEQPLPEYMIEILRQLAAGQSAKTVLINQKAHYHRDKSRAALEMLACLPFDEIINYDNYRFWLNKLGGLNSDRKIVSSFVEEGNYSDALALASMFPDLYALENDALNEHNYYMEMLNLDITLKQENRSPLQLNGNEYSMLENLAENSKSIAGVQAKGILEYFYGQHFCNCVNTSIDENKSSTTSFNPNQFAEAMGLKINADPNPASTWVTFNYQLPIGKEKAFLIIKNTEGKQVNQFIFKNETGQQVWDTRSLKSGTYIYEFSCDKLKQSGKIVIIH